jgi:hypothetical protein
MKYMLLLLFIGYVTGIATIATLTLIGKAISKKEKELEDEANKQV